jgi:transposase InsO family protein
MTLGLVTKVKNARFRASSSVFAGASTGLDGYPNRIGAACKLVEEAKAEGFDNIEIFYNQRRRHSHLGDVSPEAFERASNSDL